MAKQSDLESRYAKISETLDLFHEHAALIGKIALQWNLLHEMYGLLFAKIVTPKNVMVGMRVWQSVPNDRTKRGMLSSTLDYIYPRLTTRFVDDVEWCLGKTGGLEDKRDTAIHSPLHMDFEKVSVTVSPSDILGQLRAKRLSNKDIKLELESYLSHLNALTSYWIELCKFQNEPRTSPTWPERPSLPKPAHPTPGQGRRKNK